MERRYIYEIEFDLSSSSRDRYQQWVSAHCVEWITHQSVSAFEVRYNPTGSTPEVKFMFGFSTYQQWASFVTSERHKTATAALTVIVTGFEATLWEQGSVTFDEPATDETPPFSAYHSSLSEEPT